MTVDIFGQALSRHRHDNFTSHGVVSMILRVDVTREEDGHGRLHSEYHDPAT